METLIVMTKNPLLRRTKTRLAKERGDDAAVLLAASFLVDTAYTCARWRKESAATDQNRRLVFYVDPDVRDPLIVDLAFRAGARLEVQQGADLGERLRHAFDAEFARGARSVCVVGSDSPTLPEHLLDHAFRALLWERVVVGPTFDGGYWLLGATRPAPELFAGVPWSTADVIHATLRLLAGQGVSPHVLPFWYDVDESSDVDRLAWHLDAQRAAAAVHADGSVVPHRLPAEATWQALTRLGLTSSPSPTSPPPAPPKRAPSKAHP